MTIVEFLEARIAEDEAGARRAVGDHNDAGPDWHEVRSGAIRLGEHEDELVTFDAGISRHIVRHDPARVLREVEAKQAILADHNYWGGWLADRPRPTCERCYDGDDIHDEASAYPCLTLRAMASVYADHPDYDESWRPTGP